MIERSRKSRRRWAFWLRLVRLVGVAIALSTEAPFPILPAFVLLLCVDALPLLIADVERDPLPELNA